MMSQLPSIRRHMLAIAILALVLLTQTVHVAPVCVAVAVPLLWAKSWLLGYGLLLLGILLGMLAVLIPSMRKVLRKKE
jgi:hypothetical protein